MAFDFLSSMNATTLFLLLIIFVLFVISMKKIMSMAMGAMWVVVASVLFPIIMNKFLGFDIPIDTDSIISFIILGVGLYFIYIVAKSLYKILDIAEKSVKKNIPQGSKKERHEEPQVDKNRVREERKKEKEQIHLEKRRLEQERWTAAMEKSKKRGKVWESKYAVIEEPKKKEKEPDEGYYAHITPIKEIKHKKKKK